MLISGVKDLSCSRLFFVLICLIFIYGCPYDKEASDKANTKNSEMSYEDIGREYKRAMEEFGEGTDRAIRSLGREAESVDEELQKMSE